jgi:hypothetical protein
LDWIIKRGKSLIHMKTSIIKYFSFSLLLLPQVAGAQSNNDAVRKFVFSIAKGEKPVFNKSSVQISPIGSLVTVVTSDSEGLIYVYDNGKKIGPFKDINASGVKIPADDPQEYDPIFRKESDADYQNFSSTDNDGQITLKFQGKSYGPYQFVLEFYFGSDRKSFYAIVMKDARPMIISSAGSSFYIDGQPGYNYISPRLSRMMVTTIKENQDSGTEASGMQEKTNKAGKNSPEAYIYFDDGKKFGPYDPNRITGLNPAFSKTGGDNWLLAMNSKLYINGKPVKVLVNEKISPANIWLTDDGKRYAIIVFDRIEFYDGKVYEDPLKIRISVDKNKITVWWLSLEDGKDIVLYSRTI